MKKYATSVILQGYSSSRSGRTSAQRAPSPRTDAPVVAPTRNRVVVDSNRGFPSPKIAHAPGIRNRRSPFPDYHEENQTWLSLSGADHNQSTDTEQQSMLASVLEPEQHHKLKKLVEDQKHQSFSRPSNKGAASNTPATPSKPSSEEHEAIIPDDDGAMSDRTQATAHLWSNQDQSEEGPNLLMSMAENVHKMSNDEYAMMILIIQRETERRCKGSSNGAALGMPLVNSFPVPPVSSTPVAVPPGYTNGFIDQQALDSRKGLKRSKSGGNESAFNLRSRTPQAKTAAVSLGHNAKLDLHAVEKEDPELLSVHSDVLNTSNSIAGHLTNSSANPALSSSGSGQTTSGARPVSRTNGALHPHDKMLYGHRNTALPCLSPMEAPAQSSPLMDMNLNSRSSSRPPSRGATLANFEDRQGGGGSQSLGGNNFTAESLSLATATAEATVPIEAVNISNAQMTLDQYLTSNRPHAVQRDVSRGELVLSPFSAFDDISLGSQSVNSSISSRQQRRPRRRDTQTSTSTINTINTGASSSVHHHHHHHHPAHR